MLFRMNNLRVGLESRRTLEEAAARQLGIVPQKIRRVTLLKKAIDARRKKSITFVYHLLLDLELTNGERSRLEKKQLILPYKRAQTPKPQIGSEKLHGRPLVVGLGPAGLMAALELAENGYHPLVVERGRDLAHRVKDVETFWQTGQLDPVSNVQFGAGGAGTFSDGKLTTRVNDPIVGHILETFVAAGAPEEILYEQKPHVGTDRLRIMVTGLIHRIKKAGGEIRYETQVTDFHLDSKKGLTAVTLNGRERLETNGVILCCGHSARDTYEALYSRGVNMEAKAFAVGVRIEHSQALIKKAQYGPFAAHPKLGAADYALIYHDASGRAVYSFCMCPGGEVVASSSEIGGLVVNGMSPYKRDTGRANSALVVAVTPDDFPEGPLGGMVFQRRYEALAYRAAGAYRAPAQSSRSFVDHTAPDLSVPFKTTYRRGLVPYDLRKILPNFVTDPLENGLRDFERRLPGFSREGLMIGVETRTSAPLRIVRGENGQSLNCRGLYPCGEGAGYAGGITSAAMDGFHEARHFMARFAPTVV